MERGSQRRRNRGRARRGGGGLGGAAGGGGGAGGGFGGGIGRGAGRGGTPANIFEDNDFAFGDEHQRALVAAFAAERQLLPPSEEDAREISEMNSGYKRAVAAAAAARGRRQPSGPDEERASTAATAAARAELEGLMRKYLEHLTAGPRQTARYESVLSGLDSVIRAGKVQLDRHVHAARYNSDGSFINANRVPDTKLLPRFRVVAYGSFVSGLCSPHGDLDVAVELAESSEHRPFNPEVLASGTLKHLRKEDKAELLRKFVKELSRAGIIGGRQQLILHARVPIAKVVHAATGIKCDISVGGKDSNWKSAAVGAAIGSSSSSAPAAARGDAAALVRLAKAWARTAGLADAASSGLNSFSITLLALFHMQMTGEVGPLRDWMGLQRPDAEAEQEEEQEEKRDEGGGGESGGGGGGESGGGGDNAASGAVLRRTGDGSRSYYNRIVHHLSLPLDQRRPLAGGVLQDNAERAMEALRRNAAAARQAAAASSASSSASSSATTTTATTTTTDTSPASAAPPPPSSSSSSSPFSFGFSFPFSRSPAPPPPPAVVPAADDDNDAAAAAPASSSAPPGPTPPPEEDFLLVDLLAGFLAGLAHSMEHWRASARARARVRASVWLGEFGPGVWGKGYAVGVEDPFDWTDNTARALGVKHRNRLAVAARRGAESLLSCEPQRGRSDSEEGADARGVFEQLFGPKALRLVTDGGQGEREQQQQQQPQPQQQRSAPAPQRQRAQQQSTQQRLAPAAAPPAAAATEQRQKQQPPPKKQPPLPSAPEKKETKKEPPPPAPKPKTKPKRQQQQLSHEVGDDSPPPMPGNPPAPPPRRTQKQQPNQGPKEQQQAQQQATAKKKPRPRKPKATPAAAATTAAASNGNSSSASAAAPLAPALAPLQL